MKTIGIIGCGGMGTMHSECYEALGDMVKITCVADVRPEKAQKLADKFGATSYASGEALLCNQKPDIVSICLPTYLHTEHAVMAMEKGINVFIEKPACLTRDEASLLLQTEKDTGVKVQVGQVLRFWDEYAWLKKAVENGSFGKSMSGIFTRLSSLPQDSFENWYWDYQKSGTACLDLHIHDVDFIRYIMGEPKSITSNAVRDENGEAVLMFTTYQYDGFTATSEGGWHHPSCMGFKMRFRVNFEKATVTYDASCDPTLMVYPFDGEPFAPKLEKQFTAQSNAGVNISSLGAYYNEIKCFVQTVEQGNPVTIAPLSEGVKSVLLALDEIDAAGGCKI